MTELHEALLAIQNLGLTAKKDTDAYNYKYADLEQIWTVLRPRLQSHGLLVIQTPQGDNLQTTVVHVKTGKSLDSHTALLTAATSKNHMQDLGAAITYARRYALASMFNIITNDDDAASATQQTPDRTARIKVNPSQKQLDYARQLLTDGKFSSEAIDKRLDGISAGDVSVLIAKLLEGKK